MCAVVDPSRIVHPTTHTHVRTTLQDKISCGPLSRDHDSVFIRVMFCYPHPPAPKSDSHWSILTRTTSIGNNKFFISFSIPNTLLAYSISHAHLRPSQQNAAINPICFLFALVTPCKISHRRYTSSNTAINTALIRTTCATSTTRETMGCNRR